MSGYMCPQCEGLWQNSEHPCPVDLLKQIAKLEDDLMRRDTHPDYERGELDGQDACIVHIGTLTETNNSRLAEAVRNSPPYKTRVKVLHDLAEYLEVAGYKVGSPHDPEAARACHNELAILQKRASLYGGYP